MRLRLLLCFLALSLSGLASKPPKRKDYLVALTTDYGTMHLVLHPQTPKHRENFIKLVEQKFYDGLLFHRVIQNFMIQGGDPDSKNAEAGKTLGAGGNGYRVPAEFVPTLFHKKGALAAARDNNPEKASSGCQFYLVQGRVWDEAGLEKQMARSGRTFTEQQKQTYRTLGGSPHLDGNYTVFGQVIDGLAVIDSIAARPRDPRDRPMQDVRMTVSGRWMKKKKITKQFGYTY